MCALWLAAFYGLFPLLSHHNKTKSINFVKKTNELRRKGNGEEEEANRERERDKLVCVRGLRRAINRE